MVHMHFDLGLDFVNIMMENNTKEMCFVTLSVN